MKLHTLRNRASVATGAAVLSIALLGAACSDGDDVADSGQLEATETPTDGTTTEPAAGAGADVEGDFNGRVGAKYASNIFALVGSDVEAEGQVIVVTDGETEVRTADTVAVDGEVVPFTDPSVEEALGEDYERFEADFQNSQVIVAEAISVQG